MKRHIHAISTSSAVTVLSYNIQPGSSLFLKQVEVFRDEKNIETHQITIESKVYKLLYVALPLHYSILKKYMNTQLASRKFQVLHSHVIFPCGIVGHFLAQKFNLRHVITEHWTKIDKFFKKSAYAALGRRAYQKAEAVTVVSQQLKNTLLQYLKPRIVVIPNVIDEAEFYLDKTITKDPSFTFIAVANWAQHKNPFYFLNALQELAAEQKLKDFQVVLVGAGEKLKEVQKTTYGFKIIYPGVLSGNELRQAYNKSHVFVHGSEFETFSVVIAEALCCGLPCVASPAGIAPEVINDSNGFVTDNTPGDWKLKLLRVYQNKYDATQISENIRRQYSPLAVGKAFNELYSPPTHPGN